MNKNDAVLNPHGRDNQSNDVPQEHNKHPGALAKRERQYAARLRCAAMCLWLLWRLQRLLWWASGEDLDLDGAREAFDEAAMDLLIERTVERVRRGSGVLCSYVKPTSRSSSGCAAPRTFFGMGGGDRGWLSVRRAGCGLASSPSLSSCSRASISLASLTLF